MNAILQNKFFYMELIVTFFGFYSRVLGSSGTSTSTEIMYTSDDTTNEITTMSTTFTSSTDFNTAQMTYGSTTISTPNISSTIAKTSTTVAPFPTTTDEDTTLTVITVTTPTKSADYSPRSSSYTPTRFSSSETTPTIATRSTESVTVGASIQSIPTQSVITPLPLYLGASVLVVSLLLLIIAFLCIKNCQKDRKLRSFEAAVESQEDPWVSEAGGRYTTTGPAAVQTPLKQDDTSGNLYNSMPALAIASQEELRYILAAAKKSSELSTFTPGPENFRKRPPATGMRKFVKTNANAPLGIHTFAEQIKLKKLSPETEYEGWADNVAYEAFKSAEENTVSGVQTSNIDDAFYEVIEM